VIREEKRREEKRREEKRREEKRKAALLILYFDVRCLAFDVRCSKRRCETHLGRPVAGRHSYLGGDASRLGFGFFLGHFIGTAIRRISGPRLRYLLR
jgi:hypothetical protein